MINHIYLQVYYPHIKHQCILDDIVHVKIEYSNVFNDAQMR